MGGYLFGGKEIYNPCSILKYMSELADYPDAFPSPYWAVSCSNHIIKKFVEDWEFHARDDIEELIAGHTIEKSVRESISYENIYDDQDSLWNLLFFTGYLNQSGRRIDERTQCAKFAIPNYEILYIYKRAVERWSSHQLQSADLTPLLESLKSGDTDGIAACISLELRKTICFFDYAERYYHDFLTELLRRMGSYIVRSDFPSNYGRSGITLRPLSIHGRALVLELKAVSSLREMEMGCDEALGQIARKGYEESLKDDGYQEITCYGICFCLKECLVKKM